MNKSLVMLGAILGSTIGGYLPAIFGMSTFSFTSLVTSFFGGVVGIWLMVKIS